MKIQKTVLALMVGATLVASGTASAAKTIRYAHFQSADLSSPKQAAALAFKDYVESRTNGSINVQIYPASQLGGDNEIMEGLQFGAVEMAVVHDGAVSATYKPFNVFAMPFAVDSQYEAWQVGDSDFITKMSDDMVKTLGVRMLAVADNGIRHFTNNAREINSPEDMKGLKMRVQVAPLYQRMMRSLGSSPTPVAWPELPTALQQGVVDGQENGVTNIVNASLYQTQKYITLNGHVYSWHAYLMNEDFIKSLTPAERETVLKGTEIAKVIHRGMTAAQDANANTILSQYGMKVTSLTAEQKKEFADITQPAVREWLVKEIGEQWVTDFEKTLASIH